MPSSPNNRPLYCSIFFLSLSIAASPYRNWKRKSIPIQLHCDIGYTGCRVLENRIDIIMVKWIANYVPANARRIFISYSVLTTSSTSTTRHCESIAWHSSPLLNKKETVATSENRLSLVKIDATQNAICFLLHARVPFSVRLYSDGSYHFIGPIDPLIAVANEASSLHRIPYIHLHETSITHEIPHEIWFPNDHHIQNYTRTFRCFLARANARWREERWTMYKPSKWNREEKKAFVKRLRDWGKHTNFP